MKENLLDTKEQWDILMIFENLRKFCLEGEDIFYLYYPNYRDNWFADAVNQLSRTCKELKHIEFVDSCFSIVENDNEKSHITTLLNEIKKIDKITLRFRITNKIFEYTR